MEAAGALGAAAPILESISNPPGGAGWSWVGCGCHKDPISDQIPTCLVWCIGSIKLQPLCDKINKSITHSVELKIITSSSLIFTSTINCL